jgi:hypothetical protein
VAAFDAYLLAKNRAFLQEVAPELLEPT